MFEDPKGRREFMTLMGASLALAGLTACTKQPEEKILPYVRQPEQLVPGRPLFFATAAGHDGYARGILVESHEGRPTKVEGNPDHPASLGASDVFGQAHVLGLYDPDRSKTVLYVGEDRTWGDFRAALRDALDKQKAKGGAGLRFLTGRVTSPTFAAQMTGILAAFPAAKWVSWEPAGRDNARAGAVLAFGEPVEPQYRLDQADVILSLEADFVSSPPGEPAPRARVRLAPQGERREAGDEPTLRGRGLAHVDRRLGGPPPRPPQLRDRGLRPGRGGGRGRRGRGRRRPRLGRPDREGPEARGGDGPRDGRRVAATGRPCDRPRGERGPGRGGHDRDLHRARRGGPGRRDGGTSDPRRRDGAGRGRGARRLRLEPGLRRPRRPQDRRGARQGAAPDPSRALPRRDRRALPLAPARLARARELGRPARGGRDRLDRPAADRAPLQHALRDRGPGRLRRGRAEGLRRPARPLGGAARRRSSSRSAGTARSTTGSWPAPRSRRRR